VLLWFVLSFFFFAGLTLTISSTVTETQESQQMIGIVAMPVGFSYWFAALVINSPNSPLSIGLSLFPMTAPTIMPLRLAFTNIPTGQFLTGVGILLTSAIFTIWLAARAYELGMLRYGKRLRLADLLKPQNRTKERRNQ
ncbi:MAG TPA: ABC transporter permease, partial [Anaerolineales bacterium]|nr:ABC transporter permease [Anaerolineales bacterium]